MIQLRRALCAVCVTIFLAGPLQGADTITVKIDPSHRLKPVSRYLTGACIEDVNHEVYGGLYSQMIFGESFQEPPAGGNVSGMWREFRRGGAAGTTEWISDRPFVGSHSQRVSMTGGAGEIGVENRGLNRQGMNLLAGRSYRGHLWARAARPVKLRISFASEDGARPSASSDLSVADSDWHRYDFVLTPERNEGAGRFEIGLIEPGTVDLGYVFLEPGPWGTFKGLPVRGDVAQGLMDEGVTGLRYGGSMVNAPEYRWKKMIGDRDRRPPYRGTWYRYSTNGWGISDFLNFCEAAGFLPIPAFNINETPGDMADFIEYANGPADSPWGARRAADGHPAPYRLTHIELGNEERVDATYAGKFESLARAIWAKDPHMILTVGDFSYSRPISDPMHVRGAASRITDFSAHRRILAMARQFDAEVWFDIHIQTDSPREGGADPFPTYIDAIDRLAEGAKHHVVIFELNANNHSQRRALANAQAILQVERDGRLPFVSSANCLQVDGQNDNGWNQGLLFLNPAKIWLQPPGEALRMFSNDFEPTTVECDVTGGSAGFAAVATASADGDTVVLQALNPGAAPVTATIDLAGHVAGSGNVSVRTLAADLNAANTARNPDAVRTETRSSLSEDRSAPDRCVFPPHSFTVIRWTGTARPTRVSP